MPEFGKFLLTLAGILALFGAGALIAICVEAHGRGFTRGGQVVKRSESIREAYQANTSDSGLAAFRDTGLTADDVDVLDRSNALFRSPYLECADDTSPGLATPVERVEAMRFWRDRDIASLRGAKIVTMSTVYRKEDSARAFGEPVDYHLEQQMHDPEETDEAR